MKAPIGWHTLPDTVIKDRETRRELCRIRSYKSRRYFMQIGPAEDGEVTVSISRSSSRDIIKRRARHLVEALLEPGERIVSEEFGPNTGRRVACFHVKTREVTP